MSHLGYIRKTKSLDDLKDGRLLFPMTEPIARALLLLEAGSYKAYRRCGSEATIIDIAENSKSCNTK